MMFLRLVYAIFFVILAGCGIYTFNGSSLPSHLKTVEVPMFGNQSMEPDIADKITRELNKQILANNLLRIVSTNGNAVIRGTITGYTHEPYSFGAATTRQVDVQQYIVKVVADVEFYDNVKDAELFKGSLEGQGVYDFTKENEDIGRDKAIMDIVTRILQGSVQSW